MRILSLDPSLNCTGWSVIDYKEEKYTLVDYGFIQVSHFDAETEEDLKLMHIDKVMTKIFDTYKPEVVIAESPFYSRNPKTLTRLSHVHGTLLLLSAKNGLRMKYYAPLTIKSVVLGGIKTKDEDGKKKTGTEMKKEVEAAVFKIFPRHLFLKEYTNDVTDAISVALTYIAKDGKGTVGSKDKVEKPKKEKKKKVDKE
ncbi:Holliday junction resolvase [compost metagenome]